MNKERKEQSQKQIAHEWRQDAKAPVAEDHHKKKQDNALVLVFHDESTALKYIGLLLHLYAYLNSELFANEQYGRSHR
jgi:hypothetical protein